jgi:glucose/arabinose dehydrogenase
VRGSAEITIVKTVVALTIQLIAIIALARPAAAQLAAQRIASGFHQPIAVVADPLVPGTLIVAEQSGRAHAIVDGVVRPTPFLDISSIVKFDGEQGLLGLAFSPDGSRVFVNFVRSRSPDQGVGDTVIARFRRSSDPLVLDPASRFDLVWPDGQPYISQPTPVHKGGNLQFGPEGYLYIGFGDGGYGGDPVNNAQTPTLLLGKMLRIDVNVPDSHPRGYVIPPGNPFVDDDPIPALHEIWAFGYRNPWRYSFDDYGLGATGAMIVGDVGQDSREEVDYEPAGRGGRNYGWYLREGTIPLPGVSPSRQPAYWPLTEPMADYPRTVGRSVTGGFVYRGAALPPSFVGRYFAADFFGGMYSVGLAIDGQGEASVTDVIDHSAELGHPMFVPTFGRGLDGELYFASFIGGSIYKIVPDPARVPGAPENLSSEVDGRKVSLTWHEGAGSVPAVSYLLEAGSRPTAADLLVAPIGDTDTSVDNVPDGRYYVRVRAVGADAVSSPSNEIVVAVGCAPPAAVEGLRSTVEGDRGVTLVWTATPDATSYSIEAGTAQGLANLAVLGVQPAGFSDIVPPGTYFVRVRAVNECGIGAPSRDIVVQVP